jgi:hypothetical protein
MKVKNAKDAKIKRCHCQGILKKKKLSNSKTKKTKAIGSQR